MSVVTAAGPYGQDLAAQLHDALVRRHVEVEPTLLYDANAATFDTQTDAVRRAGTDAVVLIGAAESSRVLRALVDHGVGPPTVALFGCDLNLIDGVGERFEQGR